MEIQTFTPSFTKQAKKDGLALEKAAVVVDFTRESRSLFKAETCLCDMDLTLRDISDEAAWSTSPALGRHLRECALKRMERGIYDQMLIEFRHYDNEIRGPDEYAIFYATLRVQWDVLREMEDVYILEFITKSIREKSYRLLSMSPKAFSTYWRKGRMTQEVGGLRRLALERISKVRKRS